MFDLITEINKNIKPCPFCGSKAELKEKDVIGIAGYIIKCTSCGNSSQMEMTGYGKHKGEPIEAMRPIFAIEAITRAANNWNRRYKEKGSTPGQEQPPKMN